MPSLLSPRAVSPSSPLPTPVTRRPFRDNPRLIVAGILVLIGVLAGMLYLGERTSRLSPDFQTEVVLYALSATNVMMLLALVVVLARNIIKLLVERRRAIPFVRFRAKLVLMLLAMTIIPALLVLFVGSNVVLRAMDQWFAAPVDEVLASASQLAADLYRDRQRTIEEQAEQLATTVSTVDLNNADAVRARLLRDGRVELLDGVQVYRVDDDPRAGRLAVPVAASDAARALSDEARSSTDLLATQIARGSDQPHWSLEPLRGGGDVMRAARMIRDRRGEITGIVVVSDRSSGDLAERSRRMTTAYEEYTQLRVLQQPLSGVYLSFFVMVTLLILVSATWTGLYLAKRVTRPVQLLSVAAREIAQGRYEQRIEHRATDEFGSMIDAFNAMAAELATNRRGLERAAGDLERNNREADDRRRYLETILERVATGVVSIDRSGRLGTVNRAASQLLELESAVVGVAAVDVFARPDLAAINGVLDQAARARSDAFAQEITLTREGRERHVAAAVTRLSGPAGEYEGSVLVLDDVTPLVRAQKVAAWREVARRLAHEIKNPLTPIQLSAERLRRKLAVAGQPHAQLVQECTTTIIGEVESLKNLVDEFSQFARMPAPRTVLCDVHELLHDTLALYNGLFAETRFVCHFAAQLPRVHLDPDQIRRVLVNLVDNAIEAINRQGTVTLETDYEPAHSIVRIVVADNGPGIAVDEQEKLFLPSYSTKGRGSGLGLAIVRRIVQEHGGRIDVSSQPPHGSRFSIELPA